MEIKHSYAAGLFDGEGYVDIYKATTSKASKSPSFMLRVIISQKDGKVMNWLKDSFGGYVTKEVRPTSYIYRWDIRSKSAHDFLLKILPYLVIKKEQAEIAILFEKEKGKYLETLKGKQGFRTLTEEEINRRTKTKEDLKLLKKIYAPYIENGAPTTTKRKDTER